MKKLKMLKVQHVDYRVSREELYDSVHNEGVYITSYTDVKKAKLDIETNRVMRYVKSDVQEGWYQGLILTRRTLPEKGVFANGESPVDKDKENWNSDLLFNS